MDDSTDIYVGYRPVPPRYRRFIRRWVPALAIAMVAGGAIVAAWHAGPGEGWWDTGTERTFEGVMETSPYPMVLVLSGGRPEAILLVEQGKFGSQDRVKDMAGKAVTVRGAILERDGRRMLELAEGDAALQSLSKTPNDLQLIQRAAPTCVGETTLRGEIIDPKCFFGAMKPGEGKTHKDCAIRCISGGIPPMFLTRDETGAATYCLLAGVDGGRVDDRILPYVGDAIEIHGRVDRKADLLIFRINPADIRRLH